MLYIYVQRYLSMYKSLFFLFQRAFSVSRALNVFFKKKCDILKDCEFILYFYYLLLFIIIIIIICLFEISFNIYCHFPVYLKFQTELYNCQYIYNYILRSLFLPKKTV